MMNRPSPNARRKWLRMSDLPLFMGGLALVAFMVLRSRFLSLDDDLYEMRLEELNKAAMREASSSSSQHADANGIQPLSCGSFLQNEKTYETDPNKGRLYLRYTKAEPRFWLSLHNQKFDRVRWSVMEFGRYYEAKLSEAFLEAIGNSDEKIPRVIDVGGNIGWFSMLSVAAGAHVYTFEPNKMNHFRACETVCLNNWDEEPCPTLGYLATSNATHPAGKVDIFPLGVGSSNKRVVFEADDYNPGSSRVIKEGSDRLKSIQPGERQSIQIVPLDDLRSSLGWDEGTIDVLKIDVEGFEIDVFRGAKELIRSKHVKNIFMEGNLYGGPQKAEFTEIAELLISSGYTVYKMGGYLGPKNLFKTLPDKSLIESVTFDCKGGTGRRRTQCNLWWVLAESQTE